LFEEGIVQDLDDMEEVIERNSFHQDYRGYPVHLVIDYIENFPLSDGILKMKNVNFFFQINQNQSTNWSLLNLILLKKRGI